MTRSHKRSHQPGKTASLIAEDRPTAAESQQGSQQAAGEQAKRPDIESIENDLWTQVDHLVKRFGEADIGGPWRPGEDGSVHTTTVLESLGDDFQGEMHKLLIERSLTEQIRLLIYLWEKCWDLWDGSLAYRTLQVVQQATAKFVYRDMAAGTEQPQEGWEHDALRAVGQAMRLITADMAAFKQINLSSADGLKMAASSAIEMTELTIEEVGSPLAALGPQSGKSDDDSGHIAEGLREIESLACKNQIAYAALAHAAEALIEFESWLAAAPQPGSAPPCPLASAFPSFHPPGGEPLASVDAAIGHFRHAFASLRELIAYASVRELIAKDSLKDFLSQDSLSNLREVIVQSSLRDLIVAGSLGKLIAHASLGKLIAEEVANDQILSRCEPWERLLIEVRDIVVSSGTGATNGVFIPRRVSIRYCYPFAIEASEETLSLLDRQRKEELDKPFEKLRVKLNQALSAMSIEIGDLGPLMPTEFFAQGSGLYGGVRVDFPEIEFRFEPPPGVDSDGQGKCCRVWIVLSYMGNHCLCIQPKPLDSPLPHLLYRALHIGTPVALGARVFLTKVPNGTQVGWDNLQSFSRDVIRAIADMDLWDTSKNDPDRFVRGNLHEIVVVRTDGLLGTRPEGIANALDHVVGGRILVRSVQRTATTLEEWVRYPPVPRTSSRGLMSVIADIPEMGLAGDWCTHTGETTVFGVVAAPSWHSDVYVEATQFVSSWSSWLRLWNRRLESTIRFLELYTGGKKAERWYTEKEEAERLRHMERQVRLHLAHIKTEELTATQAHRRFLDQLLEMTELSRLERELETQLEAAEKLADWSYEQAHQKSDHNREIMLGVIAVFSIFGLSGFLSVTNSTGFPIPIHVGIWEGWVMLILFGLGILGSIFIFKDLIPRPSAGQVTSAPHRDRSSDASGKDKKAGRLYRYEFPDTVARPTGRRGHEPHRGYVSRDSRTIVQSK